MSLSAAMYNKGKRSVYATSANYGAEAGISVAIARLNDDTSLVTNSEQVLSDFGDEGRTTYQTTVEDVPGATNARYITSTGRFYRSSLSSSPIATQKIRVVASRNTSLTDFSVLAGYGGIVTRNGSKLVANKIYTGNKLQVLDTSTVGDPGNGEVELQAANAGCTDNGNGTRYPVVCANTDPPIQVNSNHIYGRVCANDQVDSTNIQTTTGGPSLLPGCTPYRHILQAPSRASLMSTTGYTAPTPSCTSNTTLNPTSGTYTGNMTISGGCQLRLPERMYIKGDLTISGATVVPASSAATSHSIVLVSGNINVTGSIIYKNTAGYGARFISFKSTDNSCTADPACTNLADTSSGWAFRQSSAAQAVVNLNGVYVQQSEFIAAFGQMTLQNTQISGSVAAQQLTTKGNDLVYVNNDDPVNNKQAASGVMQARWVVLDYKRLPL